jgi:hypothetical protein
LWEISRENVTVYWNKKLGSGAFAEVYSGKLIGDAGIKKVYKDALALSKFCDCKIAVKTLPPFADDFARGDFQQVNTSEK